MDQWRAAGVIDEAAFREQARDILAAVERAGIERMEAAAATREPLSERDFLQGATAMLIALNAPVKWAAVWTMALLSERSPLNERIEADAVQDEEDFSEVPTPCPFCGHEGNAERTGDRLYYVQCCNCGASTDNYTGRDRAVAAWNPDNWEGDDAE